MPSMQLGRGAKFIIFGVVVCTLLIGLHLSSLSPWGGFRNWKLPITIPGLHHGSAEDGSGDKDAGIPASSTTTHAPVTPTSPCQNLKGGEDVLVVMRTGATEIKDKLPAHLKTTFSCYSNYLIFSDYAETFLDYQVHDVLKDMPEDIKSENADFQHYRHIQEVGRAGLDEAELSGEISYESSANGKGENAGWKLDKWKFLPMINQTLAMFPEKKWYIFVEPDTYLVYSSLLQWVTTIDPEKAYYFGSETAIGDVIFAHGGSSFLISNPALMKGVDIYNSNADHWHEFTNDHWAGDAVLGKALDDAGVGLEWTYPMIQGGNPAMSVDWEGLKDDKTLWCSPAISYHHVSAPEVRDIWHFEQRFLQSVQESPESGMDAVIHHRDTFKSFVLPNITSERSNWNNTAGERVPDTANSTLEDCRGLCEMKDSCRQYALGPEGCSLGSLPQLGRPDENASSGWLNDRVQIWIGDREKCEGKDGWTVP